MKKKIIIFLIAKEYKILELMVKLQLKFDETTRLPRDPWGQFCWYDFIANLNI